MCILQWHQRCTNKDSFQTVSNLSMFLYENRTQTSSQAKALASLLQVDLAAQEKELFEPHSVAPWFTADVKLGCLAIHLELPSCFAAGNILFSPCMNLCTELQLKG